MKNADNTALLERKWQIERERRAQAILREQARRRANAERMARVAASMASLHLVR